MPTRKVRRSTRKAARKSPSRKPARAKLTPAAVAKAAALATRMPFVHFPASTKFADWKTWKAFKAWTHQGNPPRSADSFDVLRDSHVFAYAGPCCFAAPDHLGDASAYLDPEADRHQSGEASPFDSGALEGDDARLQTWAQKSKAERWKFLQKHVHSFTDWRQEFEKWLLHCYVEPGRYLEISADRYAAGAPDRTRPVDILKHNGTQGRARYGPGTCADRRAWTWEARFTQPVPFEEILFLHVPADRVQAALEAVQEQRFGTGSAPEVMALPSTAAASPEALYLHSQEVLEEIIGP